METLGEKIMQLRLYSRKAVLCADEKGKTAAGLKDMLLCLLLSKNLSPAEIMSSLLITKGNLTHLCSALLKENFVARLVSLKDRRQIEYRITKKGEEYIKEKIDSITKSFINVLTTETEKIQAVSHIDEVIRLMSFL